jgi:hypothetical protein
LLHLAGISPPPRHPSLSTAGPAHRSIPSPDSDHDQALGESQGFPTLSPPTPAATSPESGRDRRQSAPKDPIARGSKLARTFL